MKKTLQIHLGKQLFTIEENAYSRLENYLISIRKTFENEEGSDEIMEDIEMRFAELLVIELKSRVAVELNDVEKAITSLGEPEMIEEESFTQNSDKQENQSSSNYQHTYYRDIPNGKISGVCAGLAKSLRIDVNAIRIAFILFSVFGFGFLVYILLVLLLPLSQNHTSSQRTLFRDTENGKLGGICAGLSAYFHIDVNFVRILFIISALTFFPIIIYIVLLFVIPVAGSPSERLKMKGQNINVSNIKSEFENLSQKTSSLYKEAKAKGSSIYTQTKESQLGIIFQKIKKIIGFSLLILSSVSAVFFLLISFGIIKVIPSTGDANYLSFTQGLALIVPKSNEFPFLFYAILLTIGSLIILFFLDGIRYIFSQKIPFMKWIRLPFFITLSLGFALGCIGGIRLARDFEVKAEIEKSEISFEGNYLNIEKLSDFSNTTKVEDVDGFDFINISNNKINHSKIALTFKNSKDNQFHIYQHFSARGIEREIAINRAERIKHRYEIEGNTLKIAPNFSFHKRDGIRAQAVELIIEKPKNASIQFQGQSFETLDKTYYFSLKPSSFEAP